MAALYPANLPQFPALGHTEGTSDNVLRDKTDSGPDQTRRVSTNPHHPVEMNFLMNDAQKAAFVLWYRDTLGDGALEFEHFMPDAPATAVVFLFAESPKLKNRGFNLWEVPMKLTYVRLA